MPLLDHHCPLLSVAVCPYWVLIGTLAFVKEYNAFYPQPSISVLEVLAQSCYILFVLFSEEGSEDAVAKLQKQDTLKISFETVLQEGDQKR